MSAFIDFETLVLPASPNTCLAAPEGLCRNAQPHRVSPVWEVSAERLYEALMAAVAAEPRMRLVAEDRAQFRFHFTQTSLLLRFVDDIDVRIVPQHAAGAALAVYSRSRVGYSDLGVNAKRVDRLLAAVGARLHS